MKRLFLFLLVSVFLSLSGCVTYRNFDKTEDRQLSQEQVFKKTSSTSQFAVAVDPTDSGIRLNYVQNYDAYTVTKYGRYQVDYRQSGHVINRWGDFQPSGDAEKLDEKKLREWNTETLTKKNAKSEQQVIAKGQAITLDFPSGQLKTFTVEKDGILPLDETVASQILSVIDSLSDLSSVKVSCAALGLSQRLDLSSAPILKDAITSGNDLIRSLSAYKVASTDTASRYDEAQKALLSLAASSRYSFQKRLVKEVFDANYQVVAKGLQSQIDTLQASIPSFIIQGEIKESGPTWIRVWGTTAPRPITAQTLSSPGSQNRASNLIVEYPDESGIHGTAYVSMTHYYLAKESGVNAMGGTVPVYRYTTTMPEAFKPVGIQVEALEAKLEAMTTAYKEAASQFAVQ
jgi:hypothetical protein